jgi:hypothetical protein
LLVLSKQKLRNRTASGRMRRTAKQARIVKELMKLRQVQGHEDAGITEAIQKLAKKRHSGRTSD